MAKNKGNNKQKRGGKADPKILVPMDEQRDTPYGELTAMQEKFVQAMIRTGGLNKTACAREAGSPDASAAVQAQKWLRLAKVRWAISVGARDILDKQEIDEDFVIQRIAREVDNYDDGTPQSRLKSLELLGRWRELQLWADKLVVEDDRLGEDDDAILARYIEKKRKAEKDNANG